MTAWETARAHAGSKDHSAAKVRSHDLRHTACTRLLEAGVSFPVVAQIMGWASSTTVRMAQRYGHIGQTQNDHARFVTNAEREDVTEVQVECENHSSLGTCAIDDGSVRRATPAKRDLACLTGNKALIGQRNAMGIAAPVREDLRGPGRGRLLF